MISTNLAQILEAGEAPNSLLSATVTIFATGNMLGRLCCMIPSDGLVLRQYSRAYFVGLIASMMLLAHLLFLLASSSVLSGGSAVQSVVLVLATAFAGLSFGAIWPHMVVMTSEMFGSKHLPANYLFFDGGCGAVGTILLANILPSAFYHATNGNDCVGSGCYAVSHLIIAALCVSGMVAAAFLVKSSGELYGMIGIAVAASYQPGGPLSRSDLIESFTSSLYDEEEEESEDTKGEADTTKYESLISGLNH